MEVFDFNVIKHERTFNMLSKYQYALPTPSWQLFLHLYQFYRNIDELNKYIYFIDIA